MTFEEWASAKIDSLEYELEQLRTLYHTNQSCECSDDDACKLLYTAPEGYVLVPTKPDKALVYRVREILEEDNWRLSAENMRQLYSALIQAAQESE